MTGGNAALAAAAQSLSPAFHRELVAWQRSHGRHHLPWQRTRDPYRVWLSEIMLQQTQVATVLGYYDRFLQRFPDVAALAAAPEDDVLGLWSGLGYYSRARNLHRCAQEVVARFGGRFPASAADLATLPGIGRSTAAAIAAFCFGERVAILDGNVRRVLARLLAYGGDLAVAANERALWAAADVLLPPGEQAEDIAAYTQGLMDLGATICLPRRPDCLLCPAQTLCRARAGGEVDRYPVRSRKLRRTAQTLWVLLAQHAEDGAVWLHKRPSRGIWAGLWALPVFETREALLSACPAEAEGAAQDLPAFMHVLTHKDLHLHPVAVRLASQAPGVEGDWVGADRWPALGLPAPVRRLLEQQAA